MLVFYRKTGKWLPEELKSTFENYCLNQISDTDWEVTMLDLDMKSLKEWDPACIYRMLKLFNEITPQISYSDQNPCEKDPDLQRKVIQKTML